jgi:hypothetical protein
MKAITIADPNGGGKTTFATSFLPAGGKPRRFVNVVLFAADRLKPPLSAPPA